MPDMRGKALGPDLRLDAASAAAGTRTLSGTRWFYCSECGTTWYLGASSHFASVPNHIKFECAKCERVAEAIPITPLDTKRKV